jgi:ADP-ribose pyrophosphatase YjhB (NUDIX family)
MASTHGVGLLKVASCVPTTTFLSQIPTKSWDVVNVYSGPLQMNLAFGDGKVVIDSGVRVHEGKAIRICSNVLPPVEATSLIVGSKAFLVDSKMRIALVCERPGKPYDLPGGMREIGENQLQTMQREIEEELGLKIEQKNLTYLGECNADGVVSHVFFGFVPNFPKTFGASTIVTIDYAVASSAKCSYPLAPHFARHAIFLKQKCPTFHSMTSLLARKCGAWFDRSNLPPGAGPLMQGVSACPGLTAHELRVNVRDLESEDKLYTLVALRLLTVAKNEAGIDIFYPVSGVQANLGPNDQLRSGWGSPVVPLSTSLSTFSEQEKIDNDRATIALFQSGLSASLLSPSVRSSVPQFANPLHSFSDGIRLGPAYVPPPPSVSPVQVSGVSYDTTASSRWSSTEPVLDPSSDEARLVDFVRKNPGVTTQILKKSVNVVNASRIIHSSKLLRHEVRGADRHWFVR